MQPMQQHVAAALRADLKDVQTGALLAQLNAAKSRPLSSADEQQLRAIDEKRRANQAAAPAASSASASAAAAAAGSLDADEGKQGNNISATTAASAGSSPADRRDFESASIIIVALSVTPPAVVSSIPAFGLTWKPIGQRRAHAAGVEPGAPGGPVDHAVQLFDSAASAAASDASSPQLVQFISVETACFALPSTDFAAQQQRMKQLPAALASNKAAMEAAEASGELSDVGALYLERRRLETELKRMQEAGPLAEDVLEVRDTLQLPLGVAFVDGRVYYLQREVESSVKNRKLAVVQLHPSSQFRADPFASAAASVARPPQPSSPLVAESDILTARHEPALLRFFDNQRPHMQLLYSGKHNGMTAAAFHRLCDGKGPTLTVIRTQPKDGSAGHIIGGWAGESWNSSNKEYAADTWLFSLGDAAAAGPPSCVSKYRVLSTAAGHSMDGLTHCGSLFGPDVTK